MDRGRNVEHAPMPPAPAVPSVGVNHRQREALCAGGLARPIERRRSVLPVAAAEHLRQRHRAAVSPAPSPAPRAPRATPCPAPPSPPAAPTFPCSLDVFVVVSYFFWRWK